MVYCVVVVWFVVVGFGIVWGLLGYWVDFGWVFGWRFGWFVGVGDGYCVVCINWCVSYWYVGWVM